MMDKEKKLIILSLPNIEINELEKIREAMQKTHLPYTFLLINKELTTISKADLLEVLEKLLDE